MAKYIYKFTIDAIKKELFGETLLKPNFEDVIYQDNVKEAIRLIIEKAKLKPFNLLLLGSAGVGKSTTAKMLAVELNRPFVYLNGQMNKSKVIEILSNLKPNSLVLLDEIHSWSLSVSEIVYPVIQDGELITDGKVINLSDVMFVACTTETHEIPKPLLDRFKSIELEELDKENLIKLLKLKNIQDDVIEKLLNYTTNIRILNNLIEMMGLYNSYDLDTLKKVFWLKKIDINTGLNELQTKYLELLKNSDKPLGLRIISLNLEKSEDYIKEYLEKDLIKKKLINITSRGREIWKKN